MVRWLRYVLALALTASIGSATGCGGQPDLTANESSVRAAAQEALKRLPTSVNAERAPVVGRLPALTLSLVGEQPVSVRVVSGLLVAIDKRQVKVWIEDPRKTGPLTYLTFALDAQTQYCDAATQRLARAAFRPGDFVAVWAADGPLAEKGKGTLAFAKGEASMTVSAPYVQLWAQHAAFPEFKSPPFIVKSLRRGLVSANMMAGRFDGMVCYDLSLPF